MGIFAGMTLANYVLTNQSRNLNAAKDEVLEMVRLARKQTQTNQVPSGCSIDSFLGYGIAVDTVANTAQLTYFCPAAVSSLHTITFTTKYGGVQLTSLTSLGAPITNFYFRRLTNVTSTGGDVTICLQQTTLLKFSKLIIRSTGKIESYDNQVSCP